MLAWSMWPNAQKALITGTLASLSVWIRLLSKWAGVVPNFVQGMSDPLWKQALGARTGVYMMTNQSFLYCMRQVERGKPRFDLLINDELHRVMRTRNQTWKAFKRLDFDHYLGLSATWASRGPQDCFPVLNLVNHQTFSSYWRFVNTWCHVEQTSFGTEIFGVKNAEQLRAMLFQRYYRARTWKQVGNQFREGPNADKDPVIRRAERVPMSKQQTKLIEDLDRHMIAELGDQRVVTPNSLALLTRQLQMAVSPRILLPGAEPGAVVDWLVDKISDDPHTVVFCPFREGLTVVRDALIKDGYPTGKVFILKGGTQPEEINRIIEAWKKSQGVCLCTIQFAQAFELDTTETAYMLGFDWDPNNNYQAEGRLRRMDSIVQDPCLVRYIVPEGSRYNDVEHVVEGKIADVSQFLIGYGKDYETIVPKRSFEV